MPNLNDTDRNIETQKHRKIETSVSSAIAY